MQCEKWDTQAIFPSLMACTTSVPLSEMRKSWERESNGLKKRPLSCSFSYTFTAVWDFSKLHMCRRTLAGGREFWLPLPEDWKEKDTQWVVRHMHINGCWTTQSGACPWLSSSLPWGSSDFFDTSAALGSFTASLGLHLCSKILGMVFIWSSQEWRDSGNTGVDE